MPSDSPTKPAFPPDWANMIKSMEKAAARTSEEAAWREEALAILVAPPSIGTESASVSPVELDSAEQQWGSFESHRQEAQAMADQMLARLQETQAAVHEWIQAAESLEHRLANWAQTTL